MLGGLAGITFVFWQVLVAPDADPSITFAPVVAGLYVFSFFAGFGLWRGTSFGQKASMAVQVLQCPKLISPQFGFIFGVGIDLWLTLVWQDQFAALGFEIKLPAFHQVFINVETAPFALGVSLTALFWLVVLGRYGPESQGPAAPPAPPPDWTSSDPA